MPTDWLAAGKPFPEALAGGFEVLGEDAGFGDGGHKVGIADPAGQDVEVQVPGYASACCLAEVHAQVHAVRPVERRHDALGLLGKIHQLMGGFLRQSGEAGQMRVGDDHDVP